MADGLRPLVLALSPTLYRRPTAFAVEVGVPGLTERLQGALEIDRGHAGPGENDRRPQVQQPRHAEQQDHRIHHDFVAQRPKGTIDQEPDRVVREQHPRQVQRARVQGQGLAEKLTGQFFACLKTNLQAADKDNGSGDSN